MIETHPIVIENDYFNGEAEAPLLTKRERMINALRRRSVRSVVPIEQIDAFHEAQLEIGFGQVTIPHKSSKLIH